MRSPPSTPAQHPAVACRPYLALQLVAFFVFNANGARDGGAVRLSAPAMPSLRGSGFQISPQSNSAWPSAAHRPGAATNAPGPSPERGRCSLNLEEAAPCSSQQGAARGSVREPRSPGATACSATCAEIVRSIHPGRATGEAGRGPSGAWSARVAACRALPSGQSLRNAAQPSEPRSSPPHAPCSVPRR